MHKASTGSIMEIWDISGSVMYTNCNASDSQRSHGRMWASLPASMSISEWQRKPNKIKFTSRAAPPVLKRGRKRGLSVFLFPFHKFDFVCEKDEWRFVQFDAENKLEPLEPVTLTKLIATVWNYTFCMLANLEQMKVRRVIFSEI
jgi:hypothetical protein